MDAPVGLDALTDQVRRFGDRAYAITADERAKGHVVSVVTGWRDGEIVFAAGARTSGNAGTSGSATLLWPAPPGEPYSLIVDGEASVIEGAVVVRPTRAVLHRVAQADPSLPSCVTVV